MASAEIIDVVDDDGSVIGTISREEAERDNHIIQNALIFIFSSRGEVWVQLRPKNKNHYPGMWDISACGGIVSGEEPEAAAKRETKEETGLDVELHHVETFLNIFPGENGEERKRLSHLYITVSDEIPQPTEEADDYKAWVPAELRADAQRNPGIYVPSLITELDLAMAGYERIFKP